MIDLTNANHFLVAIASAVILSCVPLVTAWLKGHLHATKGSALSAQLDDAVNAGARIAISSLASVAVHNRTIELHNASVATGVRYALTAASAAVSALNLTPDHVAAMVAGEVAKALGEKPQTAVPSPTTETTKAN